MFNSKDIAKTLISKGANLDVEDLIYQNLKIFFWIKRILNKERKSIKKNKTPRYYKARITGFGNRV